LKKINIFCTKSKCVVEIYAPVHGWSDGRMRAGIGFGRFR
jgi:hypothetical protein